MPDRTVEIILNSNDIDINSPYMVLNDVTVRYGIVFVARKDRYEYDPCLYYIKDEFIRVDDGEKEFDLDVSSYDVYYRLDHREDSNYIGLTGLQIDTGKEVITVLYGGM